MFANGDVLYLRAVVECSMPSEAIQHFQQMQLLSSLGAQAALLAQTKSQVDAVNQKLTRNKNSEVTKGRLRHGEQFNDIWLGDEHYDLRTRKKARFCIQFLFEHAAFDESSARNLKNEIDPFVREQTGLPPAADIKIQHYFTDTQGRKKLPKLCKELIHAAGRTGRYYLNVK